MFVCLFVFFAFFSGLFDWAVLSQVLKELFFPHKEGVKVVCDS